MLRMIVCSIILTSVELVPDVQISTCDAPIATQPLSVCCFTKNLPKEASVFFSKNSSHVARISQSCDLWYPINEADANFTFSCSKRDNVSVYSITFPNWTYMSDDGQSNWGCGFYGQKADMKITALESHHFIKQSLGSRALFSFTLSNLPTNSGTARLYRIDLNQTELIVNISDNMVLYTSDRVVYTGNVTQGQFSCEIYNLTRQDNGTYICQYPTRTGSPVRLGITTVILGQPNKPVVRNYSVWKVDGNMAAGSMICSATSTSAAPLFYNPEQETRWIYPTEDAWPPGVVGYNISTNESLAYIWNVGCGRSSLPVYCYVAEEEIISDKSEAFYPQTACPENAEASSEGGTGDPVYRAYVIVTCIFVSSTVFIFVISTVLARRLMKRKARRCLRCVRSCCICCTKCLPSSDSDSDSDVDRALRRSESDNRRILFDDLVERPQRRRRDDMPALADGLHDNRPHSLEVQQALERIAMEESRQIYERQYNLNTNGIDNTGYVNAPAGDGEERIDVSGSFRSDDSLRAHAGGSSSDVPGAVGGASVESTGAVGGTDQGLRGAVGGGTRRLSDDLSVLREVETLIQQHHNHLGRDVIPLQISRDGIVENLLAYYTEESLALSRVTVTMVGEDGKDCGGITLDMYTTFWSKVQEQFFIGCERVVPELQAHRYAEEAKFRILGRILSHSVAVMKTFPIPMCKSTIIAMIYDTTEVAAETLLEDFLYFLDDHERALVTSAINHYSSLTTGQVEELADVFERFNYGAMPTEDTFKHHVTQLARHVTCIRPRTLLELMRSGIPQPHFEHFWSRFHINTLDVLFKVLRPTADRVIARLKVSDDHGDMSRRQNRVLKFLKDLLHEMSQPELETFLHFVTGKKSIPREKITIQFTTETGAMRVPKAHTCSSMLELPETYENYSTFKSELKHILASDHTLTMTME